MPKLVVREYTKTQLRILLANPQSDPNEASFYLQRRMDERKFSNLMKRLVTVHCRPYITLDDYRTCKVVPAKVVEILFNRMDL